MSVTPPSPRRRSVRCRWLVSAPGSPDRSGAGSRPSACRPRPRRRPGRSLVRATDRSTGFSQKTALPARTKRSIRSAWVSVGVQMIAASMSSEPSISSSVRISQRWACATFLAAPATGSTTAISSAPGAEDRARAWTSPMRPAPSTAQRSVISRRFLIGARPGDVLIEVRRRSLYVPAPAQQCRSRATARRRGPWPPDWCPEDEPGASDRALRGGWAILAGVEALPLAERRGVP